MDISNQQPASPAGMLVSIMLVIVALAMTSLTCFALVSGQLDI